METKDLHSALKNTVISEITEVGVHYKHVRLQHGKDQFSDTLHAYPNSWTTADIQMTDFLYYLGFRRSVCPFHHNECYCREINDMFDVQNFAKAVNNAFSYFQNGVRDLEQCGIQVGRPEGFAYFYGQSSSNQHSPKSISYGNGHIAPKSQRMKESEDEFFRYVLTWINGARDKGWTIHYRAKNTPVSLEFQAAFDFLGEFSLYQECPEFEFEACWWRFIPYGNKEDEEFSPITTYVNREFDAHSSHFTTGLRKLISAHSEILQYGISLLPIKKLNVNETCHIAPVPTITTSNNAPEKTENYEYDLAISFAGTERQHAEELAVGMKKAGFSVFYDDFYQDHLWGKDLSVYFDQVYRKKSRYCVMFVSQEYANRMWTIHECRSALARSVAEKGGEYIL